METFGDPYGLTRRGGFSIRGTTLLLQLFTAILHRNPSPQPFEAMSLLIQPKAIQACLTPY
jgi:hypothetical protein